MEDILNNKFKSLSDGEKLDALLGMQTNFQNTVGQLVLKDREREEQITKITEELDKQGRIIRERMKIETEDIADIKTDIGKKIRKFCTNHGLVYSIWSKALFSAAYGEIKKVCKAGSLTKIRFEKTKLAINTAANMVLEDLEKVKMLLVEARINDGKRFKVSPEKINYLYEAIRYHIVVVGDWETVNKEKIFEESAINEANELKY